MLTGHFYHEHTRRAVSVFGTLFNNLTVVKRDGSGKALQQIKVPLSYGPRQKFLSRIRDEERLNDPRLAIKLPRMSFEITGLEYDESTQLTRGTKYMLPGSTSSGSKFMYYPSTYRLTFELSIMSKHTDDALQILEQILPYFQPEYTVTVNEVDNNFKSDMPFVLKSVNLEDDYEGDYVSRRSLIYTLSFDTRIKYYGPIRPTDNDDAPIIKSVKIDYADPNMSSEGTPYSSSLITITPKNAGPNDNYEVEVSYDPFLYDRAILSFGTLSGTLETGEAVIGSTTGSTGVVFDAPQNSSITIGSLDDRFEVGETITGQKSGASFTITNIDGEWDTAE